MKPIYRVGFGFDVHPLSEGRVFTLGGIQIPHDKGPVGHSDADVLIHALCDALLGAAGERDIGFHFPNTDPEFKGIDSKKLLERVMTILSSKKYQVGNVDITICAEQPKINPHLDNMKEILVPIMGISKEDMGIKATTNEKLGYIGREEGIAAYAVVMLYRMV
jgi:2-C-methyl-D-erythritol 2,4-cyclodiphosphate synthase